MIPNPVLTVIVPVHGDVDATRACLASLKAELETSPGCCAILVDDASPDPRMRRLLEEFAGDPAIRVRRNAVNLGFARAVNRGLLHAPSGDVVVLNADTVLPPQCLRRFIACAQSSPDIATITPLSNNGEFTSFPVANRFNPFPAPAEFLRIDAAARSSNAGLTVDLPSGTGFCLYVTRRCLDAIGPLSERYGQGYYEDVDYCLRASERGLRNVCAPSIYVGHLGSRSFGATKRALVVNNLKLLNQRFPAHENECAAFVVADPLKEARARIERALVAGASFDRCLVAPDSWREVTSARARWLTARGHSVLLVEVARGGRASLIDLSGAAPQNLEISFAASSGAEAAFPVLQAMTYRRLEVVAPSGLPDRAICFIASQPAPVDMIFEQNASMPSGPEQRPDKPKSSRARRADLARLAARVEDRIAICPESNRYAQLAAPTRPVRYEPLYQTRRKRGNAGPAAVACGIVCDRSTIANHRLVRALARKLAPGRKAELIYFGASPNDPELMATGRVFSTGAVDDGDLPDLVKCHDVGRIFVLDRQSPFGSYRLHVAKETGLPLAYFRWPHSMRRRKGDLALDPRLTDAAVVDAVTGWLEPERGSS
ncbi:MAG: glycosyltransferase [Xanthobacteraceae bacterium]|nr:glycosyltransferase [Xanthobacteraceae bacterium]